jgi:hypothetical protein
MAEQEKPAEDKQPEGIDYGADQAAIDKQKAKARDADRERLEAEHAD